MNTMRTDITGHGADALTWIVYSNESLRKVRFDDPAIFKKIGEMYYHTIPQLRYLIEAIDKEFIRLARKEAYRLLMP